MRTSFRSPWQNGVAERFVAIVQREPLDHTIVLNEHHLRRLLDSYIEHNNRHRTRLGISKDSPLAVRSSGVQPARHPLS